MIVNEGWEFAPQPYEDPTPHVFCFYCGENRPMKLVMASNGMWCGVYCAGCGGPHALPIPGIQ